MIDVIESQWWSLEKIQEWQIGKLKDLISFLKEKGQPFYKDYLVSHKLDASDFNSVKDLQKLHIITKAEMRIVISQLDKNNFKKVIQSGTGGSTGEPLRYFGCPESFQIGSLCRNRGFLWSGCEFKKDKLVILAGGSLIKNKITQSDTGLCLPAVDVLDDDVWMDYYNRIIKFEPVYMRGYTSCVHAFCQFLEKSGKKLKLRSVITTAEQLYSHQRVLIEKTFDCKLFNEYGAYDGNAGAQECEKGGMHWHMERSIVEFINEKGEDCKEGEVGRFIVTDLHNNVCPFIRYEVGDVGSFSNKECECGRKSFLLKSLQGRMLDSIILKNGQLFWGIEVLQLFNRMVQRENLKVNQFQVVQNTREDISVRIIKGEDFSSEDADIILKTLQARFEGINLTLVYEEVIENTLSGKRRFVINNIGKA